MEVIIKLVKNMAIQFQFEKKILEFFDLKIVDLVKNRG